MTAKSKKLLEDRNKSAERLKSIERELDRMRGSIKESSKPLASKKDKSETLVKRLGSAQNVHSVNRLGSPNKGKLNEMHSVIKAMDSSRVSVDLCNSSTEI